MCLEPIFLAVERKKANEWNLSPTTSGALLLPREGEPDTNPTRLFSLE